MHVYGELNGTLTPQMGIIGALTAHHGISGLLTIPAAGNVTIYDGPYEFTPSQQEQTVEINHMMATSDITINPIPYYYGLITYNGSTITVS